MISIYSDRVREERYFQLRRKKKRYETCFAICLAAYAFLMLTELIGGSCSRMIAIGIHVNQYAKLPPYHLLPNLAVMGVGLAGIVLRKWIPALIGIVGILLVTFAGWMTAFYLGTAGIIPLAVSAFVSLKWADLAEEEGFPRFQIDFEEYEEAQKSQVSFIQHRALAQGVRTEQQPLDPNAQMTDLANASDTEALPSMLQAYHDRSHGSDPLVHPAEAPYSRMKDAPGFERQQTISPEDVGGLDAL